jgi:hypothetical protein
MLIALSGLARSWPAERRASALLAAARESKDPAIVQAAAGQRAVDEKVIDDE